MSNFFLIIGIVFCFWSCSGEKADKNILPRERFIALLIDMHILDAEINAHTHLDANAYQGSLNQYSSLLQKHQTDSVQLRQTFDFYKRKEQELLEVYRTVLDSLNFRAQKDASQNKRNIPGSNSISPKDSTGAKHQP